MFTLKSIRLSNPVRSIALFTPSFLLLAPRLPILMFVCDLT